MVFVVSVSILQVKFVIENLERQSSERLRRSEWSAISAE